MLEEVPEPSSFWLSRAWAGGEVGGGGRERQVEYGRCRATGMRFVRHGCLSDSEQCWFAPFLFQDTDQPSPCTPAMPSAEPGTG